MRSVILAFTLFHFATISAAENTAQLEEEARNLATQMDMQLKTQLKNAMKSGGPLNAITACNIKAPQIAEARSTDGWQVRRTSIRLRNPGNKSDAWERSILLAFKQQLVEGAPAANLQSSMIESNHEVSRYRFMKAIPVDEICLACHGDTIAKDVQAVLAEKYPSDAATGYKPGELRGAFTISKILENKRAD
jgi:Protein of unknown function (DUF3365)